MNRTFFLSVALLGCTFGRNVDEQGQYPRLFPKTPLSESPCLEDQDCIITHLIDGQCCADPPTAASNLYTRDQFQQLLAHQKEVCNDVQEPYTCPEHPPSGHIETVFKGACVEQRCVRKEVPADAPHIPKLNVDDASMEEPEKRREPPPLPRQIETAASPKAD